MDAILRETNWCLHHKPIPWVRYTRARSSGSHRRTSALHLRSNRWDARSKNSDTQAIQVGNPCDPPLTGNATVKGLENRSWFVDVNGSPAPAEQHTTQNRNLGPPGRGAAIGGVGVSALLCYRVRLRSGSRTHVWP